MRAYDIILKTKNGVELTSDEIGFLVNGFVSGEVPDSQMAAWLMAVCLRGLSPRETYVLTDAMVHSGRTLDLSSIPGIKVDKHSTGGVGDKTTLVLIPVLAAAGLPIVKMSGRSLGHTGGTIDKLESIPGFTTSLTPVQMVEQVRRIGAAIAAQTADLVPADKKMYALRDLTATVESIPLIASSVMSKKLAAGADAFVLDVKVGSGAFMKTPTEAEALARAMVDIGNLAGKRSTAVITDMEQPLGRAVGNALEVKEAIETLHGRGPEDLLQLCRILGGAALVLGGKVTSREEGETLVSNTISSGRGAETFREIIEAQGGNPEVVDDLSILPSAPVVSTVQSPASGWVSCLNALQVAEAELSLGAGRGVREVSPDLSVGIRLLKKIGDSVSSGDALAEIHAADKPSAHAAANILLDAYAFSTKPVQPRPLVHAVVE